MKIQQLIDMRVCVDVMSSCTLRCYTLSQATSQWSISKPFPHRSAFACLISSESATTASGHVLKHMRLRPILPSAYAPSETRIQRGNCREIEFGDGWCQTHDQT